MSQYMAGQVRLGSAQLSGIALTELFPRLRCREEEVVACPVRQAELQGSDEVNDEDEVGDLAIRLLPTKR